MISAAFDTNVVVSALLNEKGLEAAIIDLAFAGEVRLFASEAILAEYEETLSRPKFKISPEKVRELIAALRRVATLVESPETLAVSTHERITDSWNVLRQLKQTF